MRRFAAWVLLPAAISISTVPATATSVQPVVVDLQPAGRQMSQIVTVQNTFATPLPVELRVQRAGYSDEGVHGTGEETDDLLVFPPQALIEPGQSQSFRIQYVGDPDLRQSRHYFVTVAQLPVRMAEGESAVQVLYNFQVVVGVSVPGVRPALNIVSSEVSTEGDGQPRLVLNIENSSANYGYLSEGSLRIVQRDANGQEVFRRTLNNEEIVQEIGYGLVGAGQTRRILTTLVLPQSGGTVEAQFTPARR
ncbi:MAG: fimbria/pilus periplasmic chaperone [Sphingomonas sp.]|nr:fimbria/pilus periplasmic chaperone [Sphingomonas sp.]